MKTFASLAVLTAPFATTAASLPPAQMEQPSYREPARPWTSVAQAERERECRDRIEHARSAAGKPKLDRAPAQAGEPVLTYAVDHRIDGCGVLVPVRDPADIRQGPPPGRPMLRPIQPRD